jgi:cellulose synthase/poly-beta-1,6-N-acetylglucosamine synthase-like glycosyltransferase
MMETAPVILFFVSFLALTHSYVFFPLLLRLLAHNKIPNPIIFSPTDDLPFVTVIMSLYNEDKVIGQKLETLFRQHYPEDKYAIFIGSDGSTDRTNDIVTEAVRTANNAFFYPFSERRGKPGVINHLVELAFERHPAGSDHILLITDASVMLTPEVVFHLVKHYRNPEIAIVDAFMSHTGMEEGGISRSENRYISGEVRLKHLESIVWRKMIGPFGGCYALRSDYFNPIPSNFLVDDFYITMKTFERGAQAINEPKAICHEPVSHDWREEFRRKARISAGNFQNMVQFRHLWWPPFTALGFAFFSHKILRWLGPFFLAAMLAGCAISAWQGNIFFRFLFLCLIIGLLIVPLADVLLKKSGRNLLFFRNVRYFILMNLALLQGFFRFLKGIRSNVWEPTKRH